MGRGATASARRPTGGGRWPWPRPCPGPPRPNWGPRRPLEPNHWGPEFPQVRGGSPAGGGGLPWPSSTPAATLAAHCMQHTRKPCRSRLGPLPREAPGPRGPGALSPARQGAWGPGPRGGGQGPPGAAGVEAHPVEADLRRRPPSPPAAAPSQLSGRRCPPAAGAALPPSGGPRPCPARARALPGRRALRTLAGFLPLRSSSILFSMSAAAARAAWRWT